MSDLNIIEKSISLARSVARGSGADGDAAGGREGTEKRERGAVAVGVIRTVEEGAGWKESEIWHGCAIASAHSHQAGSADQLLARRNRSATSTSHRPGPPVSRLSPLRTRSPQDPHRSPFLWPASF